MSTEKRWILARPEAGDYTGFVAAITEVEELALDLPENQRAVPAAHLLGSLPAVLYDGDEGIAEALRRGSEFSANAPSAISLDELDAHVERCPGG